MHGRTQKPTTFAGITLILQKVGEHRERRLQFTGNDPLCTPLLNWPAAADNARVIPSADYTNPEVVRLGLTEAKAKAKGIKVKKVCSHGQPLAVRLPIAETKRHQTAV
jgi:hypothetical protein